MKHVVCKGWMMISYRNYLDQLKIEHVHPSPKSKIYPINQIIAVSLILVKQIIYCCQYGEYHSRFKRHLASVSRANNTTVRPRRLFFSVIICALTSSVSDTFGVVEVILFLSLNYASVIVCLGTKKLPGHMSTKR